ncbi:NAD(P)H oxidoreductase [Enterobacteriaceae bacterium 89]|nr:NAD(P)H oxidoreductase [Enterobacteriaceae bacterium 89]
MKTENIYLVWAHPRENSLTAQIAKTIRSESAEQGIGVTELDLYRRGFNPVLQQMDEPDWQNPQKRYSPEVHEYFAQMDGHDTAMIVFPVWWYSFPAMLKGYLDRVWNYGLAYGEGSTLPFKKVRMVALVGGSEDKFIQYGWQKNMSDYLKSSMGYLGIEDVSTTFLYNTIGVEADINDSADHYQQLFAQASEMVKALK